jgi:threonine dehydratase
MKLKTRIIGVAAEGAPAYALSYEAGRTIEAPVTTLIADGMACRTPDDDAVEIIHKNVDHIVRVSDDEIRDAMRVYFSDTHNVIEGAGAASLAAALKEKGSLGGRRIALIATGGNVDRNVFAKVLVENDVALQSAVGVAS